MWVTARDGFIHVVHLKNLWFMLLFFLCVCVCVLYCTHWHFELEQRIPLCLQDFRRVDILFMHVWKIQEILGAVWDLWETVYGILNVCVLCTSNWLWLNYKLHIQYTKNYLFIHKFFDTFISVEIISQCNPKCYFEHLKLFLFLCIYLFFFVILQCMPHFCAALNNHASIYFATSFSTSGEKTPAAVTSAG